MPVDSRPFHETSSPPAILYANDKGCIFDLPIALCNASLGEDGSNKLQLTAGTVLIPTEPYQSVSAGRKRKRRAGNPSFVQQDRANKEHTFHNDIVAPVVWPAVDNLKAAWTSQSLPFYLSESSTRYTRTCQADEKQKRFVDFLTLSREVPTEHTQRNEMVRIVSHHQFLPMSDLFNIFISNDDNLSVLSVQTDQGNITSFHLPPKSSFVMSDMTDMSPLTDQARSYNGFDLIVMDPPWPSKAVSRSSSYSTLNDIYDLFKLPMRSLLASKSLICIWTTNNDKHRRFIENKLIPDWGLTFLTRWYWLKATANGRELFPREGSNRQSYEVVYLAATNVQEFKDVPHDYVIIGCPVGHSRKPPLGQILEQFLPQPSAPLELFARNLTAGWTSWGNEVLHYQQISMYEGK